MDLYCTKCGEPVENDYLHDVADEQGTTYREVYNNFVTLGCEALDFTCSDTKMAPASMAWAIYDLAGDDTDFAASMFDDAEAFGLL